MGGKKEAGKKSERGVVSEGRENFPGGIGFLAGKGIGSLTREKACQYPLENVL